MRRRKPLLLLAAAFTLAGCAGVQLAQGAIEHPGQRLFNGHVKEEVSCFKCHGGDGLGSMRGPSLANTARLSDEQIVRVIDEGASIMPAYADKLTSDEKAQIVAWLRQEFGATSAE